MKLKLDRIISIATLAALLVAIVLLLRRPASVVPPTQAPAAANAQSFNSQSSNQKVDQLEPTAKPAQPTQTGGGYFTGSSAAPQPSQNSSAPQSSKAEPHINSDAVGAAINKLLGASGV